MVKQSGRQHLPPPDVHLLHDLELTANGTTAHTLIGQTIGQAKGMVSDPLSLVLPSPQPVDGAVIRSQNPAPSTVIQ
jgi:hypothetical protein